MKGKAMKLNSFDVISAEGKCVILEIMYNYHNTDMTDSDCNVS